MSASVLTVDVDDVCNAEREVDKKMADVRGNEWNSRMFVLDVNFCVTSDGILCFVKVAWKWERIRLVIYTNTIEIRDNGFYFGSKLSRKTVV